MMAMAGVFGIAGLFYNAQKASNELIWRYYIY